ncbi:MAG TPA: cyclic nucleotide-binding domain-containing protein [Anaeromyxobacteraceae bacterium]|nr:cyclic nucleotide-binding domain-containing protein [Anaeromyxobacteraceae bacterium]
MDEHRIELLQRTPIFGAIQARTLEVLLRGTVNVQVPAGGHFFDEGEAANAMFVLESGRVSVLKRRDGVEQHLRELGAGDCFGEMALIDMSPRSASVIALEECSAIRLTNADLYRVYQADLEQFALIQMNISRELSRRLRLVNERLFGVEPQPESRDPPDASIASV